MTLQGAYDVGCGTRHASSALDQEMPDAGNIFRASPLPSSRSRILVYRGSPLPQTPSVSFREPLTDCQPESESKQDSPAVTPRQAKRQPRRRAQSSRFATDRGAPSHPAICCAYDHVKLQQTRLRRQAYRLRMHDPCRSCILAHVK